MKNKKIIFLLFVIIFITWFGGRNSGLLLEIGVVVVTFLFGINKNILKNISWIALFIVITTIYGCLKYPFYSVGKDIFYFLCPVSGVLLGGLIARKFSAKDFIQGITNVGSIISIIYIIVMIVKYGTQPLSDPRYVRDVIQGGFFFNLIATVSCSILLYKLVNQSRSVNKKTLILFFLNILAIYMTGSRTNFITLVVMLLVVIFPIVIHNYRKLLKYGIVIIFFGGIILTQSNRFSNMLKKSVIEMSVSNSGNLNKNENYRGYEAKKTLDKFHNSNFYEQIFGGGMGNLVDIGTSQFVGLRYIPIMHNGYVYILIKGGVFGMILIFLWGISSFKKLICHKTKDRDISMFQTLAIGSLLAIFTTNAVITGFVNIATYIYFIILGASLIYISYDQERIDHHR